jgi:hypothetical protein
MKTGETGETGETNEMKTEETGETKILGMKTTKMEDYDTRLKEELKSVSNDNDLYTRFSNKFNTTTIEEKSHIDLYFEDGTRCSFSIAKFKFNTRPTTIVDFYGYRNTGEGDNSNVAGFFKNVSIEQHGTGTIGNTKYFAMEQSFSFFKKSKKNIVSISPADDRTDLMLVPNQITLYEATGSQTPGVNPTLGEGKAHQTTESLSGETIIMAQDSIFGILISGGFNINMYMSTPGSISDTAWSEKFKNNLALHMYAVKNGFENIKQFLFAINNAYDDDGQVLGDSLKSNVEMVITDAEIYAERFKLVQKRKQDDSQREQFSHLNIQTSKTAYVPGSTAKKRERAAELRYIKQKNTRRGGRKTTRRRMRRGRKSTQRRMRRGRKTK